MYLINHFLDVSTLGGTILYPNKDKLNETNAATGSGSIGAHVDNCLALYGRSPNIILLDYYDSEGNAPFDVAAQLNGVAAPTATVTPWTQTASSTATSTTAAGSNTGISADISSTPFKGDASSAGPVGSILAAALALALAI
jgi:hypothetical protein